MRPLIAALAAALVLPPAASAAQEAEQAARTALEQRVRLIEAHPQGVDLPSVDSIVTGSRIVPAGSRFSGPIVAAGGTLEVYGTVDGNAIAIDGDVVVHEGGSVLGDAVSVGGSVRAERGLVRGEMRSISELTPIAPVGSGTDRRSPLDATKRALGIAVGWLAILAVIGIGVLMFAGSYLDEISAVLERRFARSFWIGVIGQLALMPVLILGVVGLAITIIGLLLIPFAIVAYVLALVGILTLGFLAMARVTGAALVRRDRPGRGSARTMSLRSLMLGLALYLGAWIFAAAFAWQPLIGGTLRGLAFVVTWVAVTAGFGAAILTRAGTRTLDEPVAETPLTDEMSWQTPTPVTGVAAARRPTPVANRIPDR